MIDDCLPKLNPNIKSNKALDHFFDKPANQIPRFVKDDFDLRVEDVELVKVTNDHDGVIDYALVRGVLGWGINRTLARLRYLVTTGYMSRHNYPTFRTAGEPVAVYSITPKGSLLLASVYGGKPTDYVYQKAKKPVGFQTVNHSIELARIRQRVFESAKEAGCVIEDWRGDRRLRSELFHVKAVAKPDSFFTLRLPNGRKMYFFIELDRDMVDVSRVWQRKVAGYTTLLRGAFAQRFNPDVEGKVFRLLTITKTDSHSVRISKYCEAWLSAEYQKLFLFSTWPVIQKANVFTSPMWSTLASEQTTTLV